MKKILFFSKNLEIGGMEKSLVALLNELANYYKITLLLEEKNGILLNTLDTRVKIKKYTLSKSKNIVLRKSYNLIKRITWYILNYHKYYFSCNYATYSIIGSRLVQCASDNNSFYIHSNYYMMYDGNKDKVKAFFLPHKIDQFNTIFFVSNESKNNFLSVYPTLSQKACVVNNLFDYKNVLKKASIYQNNVDISPNNYNFIFIGRLDNDSKNLDLLINSFEIVIKANKKYKLYILGSGPYKETLIKKIKGSIARDNIILINETDNPYQYLKKCDALILVSKYEGFPVVFLEALVLNKDILTTISVSDESINIKDHATILLPNKNDIANKIMTYKKGNNNNNLNFQYLNNVKIETIREKIER